jgi:porphobilinogen synthase
MTYLDLFITVSKQEYVRSYCLEFQTFVIRAKWGIKYQGIVQRSARRIRDEFGARALIITDVCICQYNESGHCGITTITINMFSDATLRLLSKIAVSHAEFWR